MGKEEIWEGKEIGTYLVSHLTCEGESKEHIFFFDKN